MKLRSQNTQEYHGDSSHHKCLSNGKKQWVLNPYMAHTLAWQQGVLPPKTLPLG